MAQAPDPKFAKFNGDGKMRIEAFFTVFETLFTALTDQQKITKLAIYLDDEPFSFYATSVFTVAKISWNDTLNLFMARFCHSEVRTMTAAIRRRLWRDETIRHYYDDNIRPETRSASSHTNGRCPDRRPTRIISSIILRWKIPNF